MAKEKDLFQQIAEETPGWDPNRNHIDQGGGMLTINVVIPDLQVYELDALKNAIGGTRSEIIRAALRSYVPDQVEQLNHTAERRFRAKFYELCYKLNQTQDGKEEAV